MAILYGLLFWGSVFIAPITFIYAIVRHSWLGMLISGLAVLPFSLYALSGEPPAFYLGFLPIIHLILILILKKKHKMTKQ